MHVCNILNEHKNDLAQFLVKIFLPELFKDSLMYIVHVYVSDPRRLTQLKSNELVDTHSSEVFIVYNQGRLNAVIHVSY